ncbi:enoyl-CoA hydratase-related protein [Limnohabitans sp. Rim8]|uniref:enoyl-CoA hydratase-related protein n=1 Tax=Limnohabitans sp. Rim8 TaxID=1100718 RepID=UPI00330687D7
MTLNRPDRLNAWTPNLEIELRSVIENAQHDDAVRCVVITGAGKAFCAGMDMAVLGSSDRTAFMTESQDDVLQRYGYLFDFDKPLIAAINGAAVGVGLCLALYCDVRFIASGAKVAAPYTRRGLVAEHGLAWLLPRLIGPLHTADLLLSGRTIEAQEASLMGMALLRPSIRSWLMHKSWLRHARPGLCGLSKSNCCKPATKPLDKRHIQRTEKSPCAEEPTTSRKVCSIFLKNANRISQVNNYASSQSALKRYTGRRDGAEHCRPLCERNSVLIGGACGENRATRHG